MTRFSAITAIFLTGVFATTLVSLHTPSQPAISRVDESQFNDRTREMVISYYSFKSTLTSTLDLLTQGKIGLRDARNRVYESALQNHPEYLTHIAKSDGGATPLERVARNLIGHISSGEEMNPTLYVRVFALRIEFAELQRQANAGEPQSY
jgi:hypothetical protein